MKFHEAKLARAGQAKPVCVRLSRARLVIMYIGFHAYAVCAVHKCFLGGRNAYRIHIAYIVCIAYSVNSVYSLLSGSVEGVHSVYIVWCIPCIQCVSIYHTHSVCSLNTLVPCTP